ncbi:flavodoxin domain-containing protein [Lentzea sp. BCCO 10_0061]|uniref:Flavodoxin domain-containing protein n=1 Tax=Lentzea sokolovensis TaxID=3095429 RepID=A0ABU4URG1_9PSEU|nr:flavodoxin domain-containing protein [Lentzea sp. BCCO 10_0061]MDX8141393.1 flavodoxin domain-containing protein [Lentzea sp. BCCO 10_0061]
MKVLVGYATAAGSTEGIARWIADRLSGRGYDVVTHVMEEGTSTAGYDAYVLGSAVHDRAWLPAGAAFLRHQRKLLKGKPVWLFSVGLPGALRGPLRRWAGMEAATILGELVDEVTPVEHQLFTGVVSKGAFGRFGALAFRAVGGCFGDFRDRAAVETWADGIADSLDTVKAATIHRPY